MKVIKSLLKLLGVYPYLLRWKHQLNRQKEARDEKRNRLSRLSFYSSFLQKGDLVYDVGANVGNRVEIFLELGCKVVAVEPQENCLNELRKRFGSRIEIVPKGLGEKEEQKTLYVSDTSTLSSLSIDWINSLRISRFTTQHWDKQVTINLTTLEKLIQSFGLPVFCKIDVEGYELEVLKGLKTPVKMLSLEYAVPEQTERLIAYITYCHQLDPSYHFNYSVKEEMKFKLPGFIGFHDFLRVVNSSDFQSTDFGDIYVRRN